MDVGVDDGFLRKGGYRRSKQGDRKQQGSHDVSSARNNMPALPQSDRRANYIEPDEIRFTTLVIASEAKQSRAVYAHYGLTRRCVPRTARIRRGSGQRGSELVGTGLRRKNKKK